MIFSLVKLHKSSDKRKFLVSMSDNLPKIDKNGVCFGYILCFSS